MKDAYLLLLLSQLFYCILTVFLGCVPILGDGKKGICDNWSSRSVFCTQWNGIDDDFHIFVIHCHGLFESLNARRFLVNYAVELSLFILFLSFLYRFFADSPVSRSPFSFVWIKVGIHVGSLETL